MGCFSVMLIFSQSVLCLKDEYIRMQYWKYCIWVKLVSAGSKGDGLLPIFGAGSRPRNGVATRRAWCAQQGAQARRAAEQAHAR